MTIESIAAPWLPAQPGRAQHTHVSRPWRDPLTEEARHDALQAIGTLLALVEAGSLTVDDPKTTFTRLTQIEGELLSLRALVRELDGGPSMQAVHAVDVAAETCRLVTATTVGWSGSVGVVADTDARARVSAPELRRVLRNVIRNAMRAAGPQGQVRVTVSPGPDEVQIHVDDDGPGFGAIPVRNGIGLRSARRVVQRRGGRIEAERRGRLGGACVCIHLPAMGRAAS